MVCDQTAMGLPPVTFAVFLIAKLFLLNVNVSEQYLKFLCYLFEDKAWVVMYVINSIYMVPTYHSNFIPEGVTEGSKIAESPTFYHDLTMRNTVDGLLIAKSW
jgi:hypothetical protein